MLNCSSPPDPPCYFTAYRGIEKQFSFSSCQNISNGNLPGWKRDAFNEGYEAILQCADTGMGWPEQFGPLNLWYVNSRAHTMRISGHP